MHRKEYKAIPDSHARASREKLTHKMNLQLADSLFHLDVES